jgi:hypothetical protein
LTVACRKLPVDHNSNGGKASALDTKCICFARSEQHRVQIKVEDKGPATVSSGERLLEEIMFGI